MMNIIQILKTIFYAGAFQSMVSSEVFPYRLDTTHACPFLLRYVIFVSIVLSSICGFKNQAHCAQPAEPPSFAIKPGKAHWNGIFTSERYLEHVSILASDKMEGRGIGTDGIDLAASYIAEKMRDIGLEPGGNDGFFQNFTAWTQGIVRHDGDAAQDTESEISKKVALKNIIGVLRSSANSGQVLIIGAHYDHLGIRVKENSDGEKKEYIYNGADDNASGVAALLLVAEAFLTLRNPPLKTVYFVAFSGEENGLLGSGYFVENLPSPADSIALMLNLDMVGRLRNERLVIAGASTGEGLEELLRVSADGLDIEPDFDSGGAYSGSDCDNFVFSKIPAIHLFTDLHEQYNTPDDDVRFINTTGGAEVSRFVFKTGVSQAYSREKLLFRSVSGSTKPPRREVKRKVFVGTIPFFGGEPVRGVRIRGTVPGSPADKVKLLEGDVLTGIGGIEISSLEEYTRALEAFEPGQEVVLEIMRDGRMSKVKIELGKREE